VHHTDFSRRKALFCFVQATLSVATAGTLALLTGTPMLFPAYGATTFILLWMPNALPACPRSVVLSHAIGAAVGWACARMMGLDFEAASLLHNGGAPHVAAAALALGLTCALMVLVRAPHPPAGATTLIFALGQITAWQSIAVVTASVWILTVQMGFIYRVSGQTYPRWDAIHAIPEPARATTSS
jgi:CBS-domain-containing membrane protein